MHLEQETMIKEAIIATTTLDLTSKTGTCFSQSLFNKVLIRELWEKDNLLDSKATTKFTFKSSLKMLTKSTYKN